MPTPAVHEEYVHTKAMLEVTDKKTSLPGLWLEQLFTHNYAYPFSSVTLQHLRHVVSRHNSVLDDSYPVAAVQCAKCCVVDTVGCIDPYKVKFIDMSIDQKLLKLPIRKGVSPVFLEIVAVDDFYPTINDDLSRLLPP